MITKKTSNLNEEKTKKKTCSQVRIIIYDFKAYTSEIDFCVFFLKKYFQKIKNGHFFFVHF